MLPPYGPGGPDPCSPGARTPTSPITASAGTTAMIPIIGLSGTWMPSAKNATSFPLAVPVR